MLEKRLGKRISFGTAGLRATVAAGFACMNDLIIIQTTQGFCKHLLVTEKDARRRGVVIGHDHRNGSEQFARLAAGVFIAEGVRVYLFDRLVHTPMVVRLRSSCRSPCRSA